VMPSSLNDDEVVHESVDRISYRCSRVAVEFAM
jgi:hypothetical protein